MGRAGRKPKPIDKEQFEKLCLMQCPETEICAWFGVCEDTLNAWCKRTYQGMNFSEVFAQKRIGGRISLRRSQFELAKKNATMAIWLGKQYLGQRDNIDVTVGKSDGDALKELERLVLDDESGGD